MVVLLDTGLDALGISCGNCLVGGSGKMRIKENFSLLKEATSVKLHRLIDFYSRCFYTLQSMEFITGETPNDNADEMPVSIQPGMACYIPTNLW